ncbi:hypothetical protein HZA99_01565 [Candidatus Woesearchaeota archaeon]|nr:hypothetical protein [Candidatus Woesearchaeota archaeon]
MSRFDQAKYKTAATVKSAANSIPTSPSEVKETFSSLKNNMKEGIASWKQESYREHQQLSQQRQEAQARIDALRDPNQYRNMSHEQRNAHIHEIAGEMPGALSVAHAHPVLNSLTAPVRAVGSLFTLGRNTVAAAPHITPSSNTRLLLIAILYHFFINWGVHTLWDRLIWNVVMFFFVNFLVFDSSERNGDTYRNLILYVTVFEFLIPYLSTIPLIHEMTFVRLYLANGFLILTWIYYAVFGRGKNITSGPTRWARWAICIFLFGAAISIVFTNFTSFSDVEINTAGTEQWYAAGLLWDKSKEGWSIMYDSLSTVGSNAWSAVQYQWGAATGQDYYYGVVEENEKEKLGVYLANLKASQAEYEVNEPVTVFATLTAKTLGDTINAKIGCYEGNEKNPIAGSVYPDSDFAVSSLEQEDLDCTFEKLPQGTDKVTYTADFNFETIGYLKRYFADRDAIIAATQQNINLLDQYKIQDTNPVAHYTNGPVAIGMGPEQALIGVSETYTVKPRLALTLDGHAQGWGGKITNLTEVILLLPEQMSLDTSQCTDADWSKYTLDNCVSSESSYDSKVARDCQYDNSCIEEQCTKQLSSYNAYTLDVNKPEYKDIKDYITMSCRLNVTDVQGLLGATPISTKYFYVKTRYTYQISEDTAVKVTEAASQKAGTVAGETSATKSETSTVPTFSASDADEEMQYIFYHYGDFLFAAADKFSVPVCTLGGIIAETSAANPNYYKDGRKGLMGLPDTVSQQMSGAAGFTGSYNVYDAETNVKLGAAYLASLQSLGSEASSLPLVYYYGIYNKEEYDADAERYEAHVKNFAGTYCTDAGLENSRSAAEKNTDAPFVEGTLSYGNTSPLALVISYNGSPLTLTPSIATISSTKTEEGYDFEIVSLSFGNISLGSVKSYGKRNQWISFEKYPLMEVFFDDSSQQINYKYPQDFVLNTPLLLEDQPAVFLSGNLYIEYSGSNMIISTVPDPSTPADLKEVCSVRWYQDIAYANCKADGLPGLMLRNVFTHQNTLGQGDAKVQIEWSNQKQLEG